MRFNAKMSEEIASLKAKGKEFIYRNILIFKWLSQSASGSFLVHCEDVGANNWLNEGIY